jgi:hypothetical protein
MVTKMELVEGKLGRFAMKRGEEPTKTYNRLKTLVNKIRSYGSTRWMDHDVVRLMLRSFTVIDPHLVNLIHENPRYTKMTSKKILGKFVRGCMVKEARYVDDIVNGLLPLYELQPVALKVTRSKETLPNRVAQVEPVGLKGEEMALVIKRFKTALKGCKEYPNKNKSKGKRSCFKCGKSSHFIAQCPNNDNDQAQEKKGKKGRKKNNRKAKGEAHISKEWDSDCSSSDSNDEGLVVSAFDKSSLFPNEHHTCLMAKEKKLRARGTPKNTSSDEESDNDMDYSDLFKGLDRSKVDKINELIDALNDKDRLSEKQEDILYEEHDKLVNTEKSLALEVKRNEIISSELSSCNESMSNPKRLNADLNAKLEKVNIASSFVEHVSICNRCKDFDIDACNAHASTILKFHNDVANLNAQLKTCKNENDKIKFARDAYTIGRHLSIKDGLGFQKGTKNLTSQRASNLIKDKGKAHMASSSHSSHDKKNHAYLYAHVKNASSVIHTHHDAAFDSQAMFASSSYLYAHGRNRPRSHVHHVVSHALRNASNSPVMLYHTHDASFVLMRKNDKVVARNLGPKCKRDKACIWVPKSYVTNLVGPNKSKVPKTQA